MPREKFITPIAECKWACLMEPLKSKDGQYDPIFQIVLVLNAKNKEHHELLEHIGNLHAEGVGKKDRKAAKSIGHYPIKHSLDENENVIPDVYEVKFKTKEEFTPWIPCYDAEGNPVKEDKNFVANGSKVRVSWTYKHYTQGTGGVSLFLDAVQIIELIRYAGKSAEDYGFKKEEGYINENKTEIEKEAEGFAGNTEVDADYENAKSQQDDLPF